MTFFCRLQRKRTVRSLDCPEALLIREIEIPILCLPRVARLRSLWPIRLVKPSGGLYSKLLVQLIMKSAPASGNDDPALGYPGPF